MSTFSISAKYQLMLPKINFKKIKSSRNLNISFKHEGNSMFNQQEQVEEVAKLDQWSNSLPTVKRKRNITSESIMFLYKSQNKLSSYSHNTSRLKQNKQGQISAASLYLAQLDHQLAKIRKINYVAIYQNVQYCASMYQIAFNDILKKLEMLKKVVQDNLEYKIKKIQQIRETKMSQLVFKNVLMMNSNMMEKIQQQQSEGKINQETANKIPCPQVKQNIMPSKKKKLQSLTSLCLQYNKLKQDQAGKDNKQKADRKIKTLVEIRQLIQQKYTELKPIKKILQSIQQAKIKVFYSSLQLGYDVRDQGLIWILKQLNQNKCPLKQASQTTQNNCETNSQNYELTQTNGSQQKLKQYKQDIIPKVSQFPAFLTQQEIDFIISKYKNDFKLKIIHKQKNQKEQQQKEIIQNAYQNVRKERNRKLSMIKEKQLLEKVLNQKISERTYGHKYLNPNTIRLIQDTQNIKLTTCQLIYQQTVRKLNKFCIQEIHSKKQKNQNSGNAKNMQSASALKLMQQVKKMLSDTNKLRGEQQKIKTQQEKQLSDILMKLRNQQYEGRHCSQKRNPISVICCLVGWRKAKKILENEMNISMPSSH